MRITQRAVALTSLQGLNRNLDAVSKLQQQLTSSRSISAPSDSPTGTNRAMQTRNDIAATAQHARNISDGKGWLEGADSALTSMLEMTRKIRDLTVQGMNTGAMSPAAQDAIATEVRSLRESLVSLANTDVRGRPIFGGVTAGPAAYDDAGAYIGRGGLTTDPDLDVTRRVSDTEKIRIDITGPEAFGQPGDPDVPDLFAVVANIADHVTGDGAELSGDLAALDGAIDRMLTALADVGTRGARLQTIEQVNSDRALLLTQQLSDVEGIDLPEVIMKLEMQKVGYEAALSATAKAIQPTLMDFLR